MHIVLVNDAYLLKTNTQAEHEVAYFLVHFQLMEETVKPETNANKNRFSGGVWKFTYTRLVDYSDVNRTFLNVN